MYIKKCLYCGKEIKTVYKRKKFCSITCRNRYYYEKRGGAKYSRDYAYRRTLKNNLPKIQCQICGRWYRQIGSHVVQAHGYKTAREYRRDFGFDLKKGQLPEDYRKEKAMLARTRGGIKNLKKGKKFWFKKGQKGVGIYKRSKQTLIRLRDLFKFNKSNK